VCPGSGRSSISRPAISDTRCSRRVTRASASTSATTAISRKARALGLAGAEIVFEPSATTAGHSEYLWEIEAKSHAVANGYFVGTNNRVGKEAPWNIGEFYGKSYFCDPRGNIMSQASRDKDELVVADCDLEMIEAVRTQWQFYRDRRPELYGPLARVQK
ncbi:MAG: Nitrilase/cyanide hydratase and apolipoprotein N-acyltransferase, partial [bacterium]|nr:Nitrilase/cyanide hydratase and apolipoprotein N-acyltransferase [bacterium]